MTRRTCRADVAIERRPMGAPSNHKAAPIWSQAEPWACARAAVARTGAQTDGPTHLAGDGIC